MKLFLLMLNDRLHKGLKEGLHIASGPSACGHGVGSGACAPQPGPLRLSTCQNTDTNVSDPAGVRNRVTGVPVSLDQICDSRTQRVFIFLCKFC